MGPLTPAGGTACAENISVLAIDKLLRRGRTAIEGSVTISSRTSVTPGTAQAARSAMSRSNQAWTLPLGITLPPSVRTVMRVAVFTWQRRSQPCRSPVQSRG